MPLEQNRWTERITVSERGALAIAGKLDAYNQALAALDDMLNDLESAEAELNDWNRRYLSATEAHYGPDSASTKWLAARARANARSRHAKVVASAHRQHRK